MRGWPWMVYKEWRQIGRDRRLIGLLIFAPVFQLLIMGFAATTDVNHVAVALRDEDHTPVSRDFARTIGATDYLAVQPEAGRRADDERLLVGGHAGLVVVLPRGFAAALARGEAVDVQVLADGSDSTAAMQGLNYLQAATLAFNRRLAAAARAGGGMLAPGVRLPSIAFRTRVWYNPDLLSRFYMVPALAGLLLLTATMLLSSLALVKEREDGTLEQLLMTPLKPSAILFGKLVPFALLGLLAFTAAMAVVTLGFGVWPRSSWGLLYLGVLLFLLSSLGLGLMISTFVHTQQQAMLVAGFGVMMPFTLLSGFIFPVENMPLAIEVLARSLPMTYFYLILRGVFLKGTTFVEMWPSYLVLLGWGMAVLVAATARFHRRLE